MGNPLVRDTVDGIESEVTTRSGSELDVEPPDAVAGLKVAVTPVAPFMVTVQVPVPLQPAPLQPVNFEPDAAFAVSVTRVPAV
jgi:hypothetical protein